MLVNSRFGQAHENIKLILFWFPLCDELWKRRFIFQKLRIDHIFADKSFSDEYTESKKSIY